MRIKFIIVRHFIIIAKIKLRITGNILRNISLTNYSFINNLLQYIRGRENTSLKIFDKRSTLLSSVFSPVNKSDNLLRCYL